MKFYQEERNYITKSVDFGTNLAKLNFYTQDLSGKTYILDIDFYKLYPPENYLEIFDRYEFPVMGNKYLASTFYNYFHNKTVSDNSDPTEFEFLHAIQSFIDKHKQGYADFEKKIEEYLMPFPLSNENILFAIKRMINHYETFDPSINYSDFNSINFSNEGYEAGLMLRASEFILDRIDLFIAGKLNFIIEDKLAFYKTKNLLDYWKKPASDYIEIEKVLLKTKYIKINENGCKNWSTPENKTGGKEFANLLLVLEKTRRFNFRDFTEAQRYIIINNSISLPFKADTLKSVKIEEVEDSSIMNFFERLFGK